MKRVLVTGARGFVGRHAIAPLLEAGFDVIATSRRGPNCAGATCVPLDLCDPVSTNAVIARFQPTHLLHLAWDVTHGSFWTSGNNLDWAAASLRLYRCAAAAGCRHVTVAGTCAEYDWSQSCLDEGASLRPATPYGITKDALHRMLRSITDFDGISLAWGRIFLLYGSHEQPSRLVPSIARKLLAGEPAYIANGSAKRDFMHVADVAAALVAMTDRAYNGVMNIASGQSVPLSRIGLLLGDLIGRSELLQIGSRAPTPADPAELAPSGERLREFGFKPRYALHEGLAETLAWWAAQP